MPDKYTDAVPSGDEILAFPRYFQTLDETNGYLAKFLLSIRDEIAQWESALDELKSTWRTDRATRHSLSILAHERGLPKLPDFFSDQSKRRFLRYVVRYYLRKGTLDVLVDAIRAVTGLRVKVYAPWADPDNWIIGVDELGIGTLVGLQYEANSDLAYEVGTSVLGVDSQLEGPAENQADVYTFYIEVPRELTTNELSSLIWVVELLKRSVDHYCIRWPSASGWWTISYSKVDYDTRVACSTFEVGFAMIGVCMIDEPYTAPTEAYTVLDTLGDDTWLPPWMSVTSPAILVHS